MGYDLHITRATFWPRSSAKPITRDEWRSYVLMDSTIQADPLNGPDDFLFVEHPNGPAPLWWYDGRIDTKNPDDPMISKLCEIAQVLQANLIGDEEETYCKERAKPG